MCECLGLGGTTDPYELVEIFASHLIPRMANKRETSLAAHGRTIISELARCRIKKGYDPARVEGVWCHGGGFADDKYP